MEGIGNKPLLKLKHLTDSNSADIYIKIEGANPTGCLKDRMALAMIEGVFSGTTSGANLWVVLPRAKIIEKVKTIVTVVCD